MGSHSLSLSILLLAAAGPLVSPRLQPSARPASGSGWRSLSRWLETEGFGGYAGAADDEQLGVEALSTLPMVELLSRLRIESKQDRKAFLYALSASGAQPVGRWTTSEVALWVATVLPGPRALELAHEYLDGAAVEVLGGERELVELGFVTPHARLLWREVVAMRATAVHMPITGGATLREWVVREPRAGLWLWLRAMAAPRVALLDLRLGGGAALRALPTQHGGAVVRSLVRRVGAVPMLEFWSALLLLPHSATLELLHDFDDAIGAPWAVWALRWHCRAYHLVAIVVFGLSLSRGVYRGGRGPREAAAWWVGGLLAAIGAVDWALLTLSQAACALLWRPLALMGWLLPALWEALLVTGPLAATVGLVGAAALALRRGVLPALHRSDLAFGLLIWAELSLDFFEVVHVTPPGVVLSILGYGFCSMMELV